MATSRSVEKQSTASVIPLQDPEPSLNANTAPQSPQTDGGKGVVASDQKNASEPVFDKDELIQIFDEMIFSGEYTEEVLLRKKVKVTFRSRSAADTAAISKDIDSQSFNLLATLSEYRAIQNLAYSLVGYSGKDLSILSTKDRVKFVEGLPAVVVAALSEALFKFDQKITAACAEGESNF